MILLDAIYINQSGGKVLLEYFIENLEKEGLEGEVYFLIDSRLNSPVFNEVSSKNIQRIDASESSRRKFYRANSSKFSKIFCFGNVPPPSKLKNVTVYILFHNALILTTKYSFYSKLAQFSFFAKRLYIRYLNHSSYTWIVQTEHMAALLSRVLNVNKSGIKILPFYAGNRFKDTNRKLPENNDNFLYVADGVKQKNHFLLLKAWEWLFINYHEPIVLHLTISPEFDTLISQIEDMQKRGVRIINHGQCNYEEIKFLYTTCNYFVMPSLSESFGLPLIESAEAGCEIIASDLEYVYDVVIPMATFDPNNIDNMAQTIMTTHSAPNLIKTKLIISNKISNLIKLITTNV